MKKLLLIIGIMTATNLFSKTPAFESDVFETSMGKLTITFIGHGSLMFEVNQTVIHVDPVGQFGDYSLLSQADLILITHDHYDHLDLSAIKKIAKSDTKIIIPSVCKKAVPEGFIMQKGASTTFNNISIEAVPAYNIKHKNDKGEFFHPKGVGNGYVLTFGNFKVYVAGDTENTPEMKSLKNIDVAFLPMNLPFTMTPEMVADAARSFKPKILYPYHYGNTDPNQLVKLLKNEPNIEVRIRKLR